ncbi:S8 family serine peptidase [Aquimonas voraii]|uniref:Serine protease, subtilisin family n=1 Tax=Aquimonas voraii TaxID=265719 RepID=A0A1G6WAK9_9GAMM|nr:S8 family serine peptidase [Aquimonas voraii]SDD62267.1 Serine protease, subtilisin family [Aquimonas voraii]
MKPNTPKLRIRSLALMCALLPAAAPAFAELPVENLLEVPAQYSEADASGRFVYLIRFAEAGLAERARAAGEALDARSDASKSILSEIQSQQRVHLESMSAALGRGLQPSHYYLATHSGVAARLTPAEAQKLLDLPGVVAVEREQVYQLETRSTPEFIGANTIWSGANVPGGSEVLGQGMITAILDSGVVPSHPSFTNETEVCGFGQNDVPNKLLSAVDCAATDPSGLCAGPNPADVNGHGTHVASTAAGNFVGLDATPAPVAPIAGIAPCSHIRSYKVCPGSSCPGADLTAGLNHLLLDGDADVMNYSISGGASPWTDFDRTKLDLVNAGIMVVAAAGNTNTTVTNPIGAVNHRGPWVMAVANTTHDRVTSNPVSVSLDGPQNVYGLKGLMTIPADVTAEVADSLALGNELGCDAGGGFPAGSMTGKIALISRGTCAFTEKLANAQTAGAIGAIIFNNNPGQPPIAMGGTEASIPAVMVFNADGLAIRAHVTANAGAQATISATSVTSSDPAAGDILASSSLRGPTPSPLQHLQKPDIAAPGTGIYAALATPASEPTYGDLSGTSMASPHVAGSAVLVRQIHPTWTVQEVKSALQMTAKRTGSKDFVNGTPSSGPWDADDVGSGRVDLTKAARAGLVMDETTSNFLAANPATGGDVRTLNLPALRNLDCSPTCTFTRTVRNTLSTPSTWTVAASLNTGSFDIQVSPTTFEFAGDLAETRTITITVTPNGTQNTVTHFGAVTFTEAGGASPQLHWPMAIRGLEQTPPVLQYTPEALDTVVVAGGSRTLPITITNASPTAAPLTFSFAEAPARAVVLDLEDKQPESLSGGVSQPINLQVDGGIATIINVATQQWTWFNRFSPTLLQVPFTLQQVQVGFAPGNGNVLAGDLFDVHVWIDPDRDPTNGATLVASVTDQVITAGVGFKTVNLPAGVEITAASGDVLVGVVNRSARGGAQGAGYGVAIGDSAGNSQQRSWAAFNFPGGIAPNPPVLTEAATLSLIDSLVPGRNWSIRATGTGGTNCLAPSEVPWVSVAPASGTVAGNASTTVQVTTDSTGLAPGQYDALLCLESNDPERTLSVVPVSMQVVTNDQLPSIALAPPSLSLQATVGSTATDNLGITNNGTLLPLNWEITEASTVEGGNIVRFDNINFTFPADFDGGSVKWGNGETCAGCFEAPFDLNVYATPNMAFYWPNVNELGQLGGAVWNGTLYTVLQPGDTVGPDSTFGASAQSAATAAWRQAGGVDGYLGFRFINPSTQQLNFGYARLTTTGTTGYPAVLRSIAFDSTGAAITIPLPSVCDSPSSIPWLSTSVASGSTAAGATSTVGVTADATGLAAGTVEATICVRSNDAANPLVEVPVSLEVQPLPPEIFANGFEGTN